MAKLYPKYAKLMDLLYELGDFGTIGPEPGKTVTNFPCPEFTQSTFIGKTEDEGFLKFSSAADINSPFYYSVEEHTLTTNYPELITHIHWQSDEHVTLMFMSGPYGVNYYCPDKVYPILDNSNNLMIACGTQGTLSTKEYSEFHVYANKKCNVTLKLNMGNPLSITYPLVTQVPTPTYLNAACKDIIVAYSTLVNDITVNYEAAPDFIETAALIKNIIESYSKPNPTLSDKLVVGTLDEEPQNKNVVILQNIEVVQAGIVSYYGTVRNVRDQYNTSTSRFTIKNRSIGKFSSLYNNESEYPVIYVSLCFDKNYLSDIERDYFYSRPLLFNIGLTETSGVFPYLIDASNKDLVVWNVKHFNSANSNCAIFSARFDLNSKTPLSIFSLYFSNNNQLPNEIDSNCTFKMKVTFNKRSASSKTVSFQNTWDPFAEIITPILEGGTIIPPYECTTSRLFLMSGGSGGFRPYTTNAFGDYKYYNDISGGGGGRGISKEVNSFKTAVLDSATSIYVTIPIDCKIGNGGSGVSYNDQIEKEGGQTVIQCGSLNVTAPGGKLPPYIPYVDQTRVHWYASGWEYGGGAGSWLYNGNFKSGEPGINERIYPLSAGYSGRDASPGKGGSGGDGPYINFPTIKLERCPGSPGSKSNLPSGGGAGGITLLTGGTRGSGGNGEDSKGPVATDGEKGYACIVFRYIDY
jgi:hypothetical protein